MPSTTVSATITIDALAKAIFAVLADPAKHAGIDGTGWVGDPVDRQPLTSSGQIFRMAMYHPNHPNGNYEMANQLLAFDPPTVISWKPGYYTDDGTLAFGGWMWRYDLAQLSPSETEVRLSYDWSAVPEDVHQRVGQWPPFSPDHLNNSLAHLAEMVVAGL